MKAFFLLTIFAILSMAQDNVVIIPHVVSGGGVQTEVTLINPTSSSLQVMVYFRLGDGNGGLHAPTINGVPTMFVSYVLSPLGSRRIKTEDAQWWTASGYIEIRWLGTGRPLASAELVRGDERMLIGSQAPTNKLWLPFDNVGGTTTLVVVKTGPTQFLRFDYYDEDGGFIGSHSGTYPQSDRITIRTDQYVLPSAYKTGIVAVYQEFPSKGSGIVGKSIIDR